MDPQSLLKYTFFDIFDSESSDIADSDFTDGTGPPQKTQDKIKRIYVNSSGHVMW